MPMGMHYIEFRAFKDEDESGEQREATAEEIAAHFRIKVVKPGYCEIEVDDGYSLFNDEAVDD